MKLHQNLDNGFQVKGNFLSRLHGRCTTTVLQPSNTKYRKGSQRTSTKTTKDCGGTAKDLHEDHTGQQSHIITRGLTWHIGDWCYPRHWRHHRLLHSDRNWTSPCCRLCQWLCVALLGIQLTRLCDQVWSSERLLRWRELSSWTTSAS